VKGRCAAETVAKLVIYQRGVGVECGSFPVLNDGVYVLIRVDGAASTRIWVPEMTDLVFPQFFALVSQHVTLGVAPMHYKRFAYFRVESALRADLADLYHEQVALFLAACHRVT
jgi:hypothetical protein